MAYTTFPTSVIGPSLPIDVQSEPKILKAEFGDGYTAEAPDGINFNLKTFNLTWDAVIDSEKSTILNFIEARGGYQTFEWTYGGTTYKVKCRKWGYSQKEPNVYSITATFEEVPI